MKMSSENENFVRGGMVFHVSSENDFFDPRASGEHGFNTELSESFLLGTGSTGVERYGCIPWSAASNSGEIPPKMGYGPTF